jgi:hypothetical protein
MHLKEGGAAELLGVDLSDVLFICSKCSKLDCRVLQPLGDLDVAHVFEVVANIGEEGGPLSIR